MDARTRSIRRRRDYAHSRSRQVRNKDRAHAPKARLKEPVANKLAHPPASPDSNMALHHPQRGAVPELRSGLRG